MTFARGRGAALADLNLDGLLDLVEVNRRTPRQALAERRGGHGRRAGADGQLARAVASDQPAPNRDAIGAWVEVRVGDRVDAARGDGRRRPRRRPARLDPLRAGRAADGARSGSRGPTARSGPWMPVAAEPVRDDRARRDRRPSRGDRAVRRARDDDADTRRPASPRSTCPTSGCPSASPELPAVDLRRPGWSASASGWTPRGYDRLVVYADREHSANLSYLTGFDPRFEEAILDRRRRTGDPAILVGNECYGHGRRRAAADATATCSRTSACRASRATGRGRSREILGDEGIGPGARVGVVGWKTVRRPDAARRAGLPRRRAARAGRRRRGSVENADGPPDRRRRRAAGHQRGRAARRDGVGRLPDLERRPAAPARASDRA